MENLIFSLNATIPVFVMMLLGMLFHKFEWIDDSFASKMNRFVFLIPLPVLLFEEMATVDFSKIWNPKFLLFCLVTTFFSIGLAAAASLVLREKTIRGEFIQASYRSSAALLGIALIQNIYGNAGMAPLMIIGSAPLYNMMAVVILSLTGEKAQTSRKKMWKKTLKEIATNPIIWGILLGILWSALHLPMPSLLNKTVSSVGGIATPMGLMAMGASFDFKKAFSKRKPAFLSAFIKLIGFCAIFLPIAVWLGFRREELVAILIMLGSATTVSSYVMARSMGHEGTLTSSVVMLTTLLSAFTITGWIYLLRSLGLI